MPLHRSLLAGLASLAAVACTAEAGVATNPTTVPQERGTYQLLWTVDRSDSPAACAAIGADVMVLTVYTSAPQSFSAPCENFNLSVDLPPGTYAADAQLIGPDGFAATPVLQLNQLVITSGSTLTSDTDF